MDVCQSCAEDGVAGTRVQDQRNGRSVNLGFNQGKTEGALNSIWTIPESLLGTDTCAVPEN